MQKKPVKVEWSDSCEFTGWDSHTADYPPVACTSVGFIVKRTKKALTLSATISLHNGCQHITIPRGCITKITELTDAQA